MNKILFKTLTLVFFLSFFSVAFAALDVSLTTDTVITVAGINLTVSTNSTIDSISVGANTFDVTLSPGAAFTVTSADRRDFDVSSASGVTVEEGCGSNSSSLTLSKGGSGTATVTVTPSVNTCSGAAAAGTGTGGGISAPTAASGGAAVSAAPTVPAQVPAAVPAPVPAPAAIQLQQQLNALIAQLQALLSRAQEMGIQISAEAQKFLLPSPAVFTKDLTVGSEGEDVRALQKFLNAKGFKIAESGPGAPGNETTIFGHLTKSALAKYQKANNISPVAGYFGLKTRTHIKKVLSQ